MAEAAPILMRRVGASLRALAPIDEALLLEFPTAKNLRVRITQPRNVGRLRLYFALLRLIADNLDNPPPLETLHLGIKMRLGLTTPVRFAGGKVVDVPRSVAFDAMPEDEFAAFFEAFRDLIRSNPQMERAAQEMLGEPA
jgi:hypothetical protein